MSNTSHTRRLRRGCQDFWTQGGAVTGVVVSDAGQPVPGADVHLSGAGGGGFGFAGGPNSQEAITDGTGTFRFDHLDLGRYTVDATLGSHTSAPVDAVLVAGQAQAAVTLQLQVGSTIQGTVSGLPDTMLAGTMVSAAGTDSYFQSTRVGADGHYEVDNVPAGVVTMRATATDPSGSSRSVTKQVTASADAPVITADLVFDVGYTLSGRVTKAGQPVSGARVFAVLQGGGGREATATSDDSGAYQLTGLQQGTYTVAAMSMAGGGAASRRETITLTSDSTLDLTFASATLAGQVVDADGNAPLANATVTVTAQESTTTTGPFGQRPASTDSNGRFSFSGLDEESYQVSASLPDYQLEQRKVSVGEDNTPDLVIALKRGAGIGIRALDGLLGVPLRSLLVRVLDPGGNPVFGPSPIALDGDGLGEIPSLPPGTYTVVAQTVGYAPVRLDGVNVPSATVAVGLTPGGTILIQAGTQTLAGGTAIGTLTAVTGQPALLSLGNMTGRVTTSEPNLQLRNVPPGSYVLAFPAVSISQALTVNEGAQTTVHLP